MRIRWALAAVAVTVTAGLSGCTRPAPPPVDPATATSTAESQSAPQPAPLPDPQALIDVLVQLTDPAVPGSAKLHLIEGASGADEARLDNFTTALVDTQSLPLTFAIHDLTWSDRDPGNVRAGVDMVAPPPRGGLMAFPMEFAPAPEGWQLTRDSADTLLTLGPDQQGLSPGSATPAPEPAAPAPEPPFEPTPAPAPTPPG